MKILSNVNSLDYIQDGDTRILPTKTESSGSGNVVSSVSISGDTITYNKGVTALTAHQNAFSNVKVGSTTVAADTSGDTLELVAGDNVTLTPDSTNDKVTISATDTTYESKAAASGGTAVSLVTTGEKYTWNNKQNALSTQTAYSAKGSATKVPQITTNTLGQVTKIEEVTITQPTVNNGTLTIQKNGNNVATFGANQSGNATANIEVPTKTSELTNDSGYVSDLSNYVTLNGAQTITGNKTFSGNLVMTDVKKATYTTSNTSNITPNNDGLSNPPWNKDLWHDHFAFLRYHSIDSQESTTDGETWTTVSKDLTKLFWQKEGTGTVILDTSELAYRFTLKNNSFAYSSIAWFELAVGYDNPFSQFNILIEHSADKTTWNTCHNSTITGNSSPYFLRNGYSPTTDGYLRFTFTKTTNLTTGKMNLTCIKGFCTRKGSQGLGSEFEYPYDWDTSANILPISNNNKTLGSSSKKWSNVYATTFNGNLTGDVIGNLTGIASSVSVTDGSSNVERKMVVANGNNLFTVPNVTANYSNGTITATKFKGQLDGSVTSTTTGTTQSPGDNSTKIATTAFVKTAIDNLPEPMVFKGSLGTGGTVTALPVDGSATVGDTYKVITAGTYASKAAKVGDTFICLTKTSSANTWELIPSGDEPSGTVTSITLKATSPIAIDSSSAITTSGTRTLSHANSGVTAGTYRSVTVNATGHVTAGTNPTTLSGYGITDAKIANGVITLGSNTITPLTASSTLDATKVSGTLPTSTYTDTKNTAGSTDSSSKLFLVGATSQAANPQTYSQDTAYVDTNGHLYSNSKQVVNLSDSQALTNKTYNGYTLAAACAKAVVTSIDTSASLPTSNAVKTFVEGKGYVLKSGDTMTGILGLPENAVGLRFRNNDNYNTTTSYQTAGNEALVFGAKNVNTSFMFVNGEDSITNHDSNRWQSLTPGLQIKKNSVAIGKLIGNNIDPTYKLDVNGTTNSTNFSVNASVTLNYNSTDKCLEFNFV